MRIKISQLDAGVAAPDSVVPASNAAGTATEKVTLGDISRLALGDVTFSGVQVIGAGEDSGDGAGYGTLELVPDASLISGHQYLVVDPTYPGHIHLRAGGPQDGSNAELILGGEHAHVRVLDDGHQVAVRSASGDPLSDNDWTFGNDGVLDLASGGIRFYDNSVQTKASISPSRPGTGVDNLGLNFSFLGTAAGNTASGYYSAVVAGGRDPAAPSSYQNAATGNSSFVGAGYGNTASGPQSFVGGGRNNTASGNYSVVLGGKSNTASGGYAFVGGGLNNDGGGYCSTVGGGWSNTASGGYSTVSGGYGNTASNDFSAVGGGKSNTASSNYSTVSGGKSNTASGVRSVVGGGFYNTASGYGATVSGGQYNVASGPGSFIGGGGSTSGGYANSASGGYSVVTGGFSNAASGEYSAIGGGSGAVADRYGMYAHSAGAFETTAFGSAQRVDFVLRTSTTNATPTTLMLNGASTRLTIPSGKALFATVNVAGIINGGSKAVHYVRKVAIKNVGGTTALIGTVSTLGTDVEDDAAYDVAITADNSNDALQISVTGKADETIRWVAHVEGVEIAYG